MIILVGKEIIFFFQTSKWNTRQKIISVSCIRIPFEILFYPSNLIWPSIILFEIVLLYSTRYVLFHLKYHFYPLSANSNSIWHLVIGQQNKNPLHVVQYHCESQLSQESLCVRHMPEAKVTNAKPPQVNSGGEFLFSSDLLDEFGLT